MAGYALQSRHPHFEAKVWSGEERLNAFCLWQQSHLSCVALSQALSDLGKKNLVPIIFTDWVDEGMSRSRSVEDR